MENEAQQVAAAVRRTLEQQMQIFTQLKQLAAKQRQLIEHDQTEPLLALLGARQKLINRLLQLDGQMGPLRQRYQRCSKDLPAQLHDELQAMVEKVRTTLGEILQSDRADSELLAQRKGQVGQQLGGISQVRRAHAAYGSGAGVARAIDRKDTD